MKRLFITLLLLVLGAGQALSQPSAIRIYGPAASQAEADLPPVKRVCWHKVTVSNSQDDTRAAFVRICSPDPKLFSEYSFAVAEPGAVELDHHPVPRLSSHDPGGVLRPPRA